MSRGRVRVGAAVVAALVVAEAAVLLLQPRGGVITPAAVDARSYFSASELDRARDFRRPQALLGLLVLAIEVGALAWVVARPPARLAGPWRRPAAAGAAVGAGLAVLVAVAPLPVRAVLHERAADVGLSTQTWPAWLGDVAKGTAISAAFAAGGGAVAVVLLRRRRWWLPAAAVVWVFGAATVALGPIVLDPVFNRFEPAEGRLRADVLELADRAGVRVGQVQVMDASRRTTAANAYVAGLGPTKRVVLYDTLVGRFPPREVRIVVAHELGHQRERDLQRGLLFLALVAPAGTWAAARWARGRTGPAALPALALAVTVLSTGITWVSNGLSRQVEARADAAALRLTEDPDGFVAFEQRIARQNLVDPDPPDWQALLSTHPTVVERIGYAVALRRAGAAAPDRRTPAGS